MKVPYIQINTTPAKLGLSILDAKLDIKQPKANLSIHQPSASVEIRQQNATLNLDTTQGRRDLGYYNPFEFSMKTSSKAKSLVLNGIARRASEGTQLMQIENKTDAISSIAKSKMGFKLKQLSLGFIPSINAVDIKYVAGNLDINTTPKKPVIDANQNNPQYSYSNWDVNGYMIQYPSIEIDVKA